MNAGFRPIRTILTLFAVMSLMGMPFVVLMPLVALAPTADHRFNLYWHGGLFRDDPLRIVPHTLHSLPGYLTLGNFRPLGRMLGAFPDQREAATASVREALSAR